MSFMGNFNENRKAKKEVKKKKRYPKREDCRVFL